jgi:DNA polymerase-3 subunit beta
MAESGRFTVPARKFIEIVRELPEGTLSFEVKENKVSLEQQGQGRYVLMGLPPEDYPEIPSEIEGTRLDLGGQSGFDGSALKNMIAKTAFAVSRDETRPVLNGVLCQIRGEGITMVATDGHRLVRHHKAVEFKQAVQGIDRTEVIIPPRALQHLVKLLAGGASLEAWVIGSNHILFDLGPTKLFSRLIEGPYVDFEQVIPKNNDYRLTVSSGLFTPSVRRVSILSSTQTHQIRLHIEKDELELSAVNQEFGGEARESIRADYGGKPMDIGYNSVYLLEILKRMDSEEVILDLNSPITAGIFRPGIQPEGEDYLCLLMPLRLSE